MHSTNSVVNVGKIRFYKINDRIAFLERVDGL